MQHTNQFGYGYWPIVIFSAVLMTFIVFTVFKPSSKRDWKSLGALSAFFVALFTEMYGFPFTIYLLSSWLGKKYPVVDPFSHNNGHLLEVFFAGSPWVAFIVHPGSDIILGLALVLIAAGWRKIHAGQGQLVKDGIYKYIRHPQYTGFFMIIIAFLIQWPTLITLALAPLLIGIYSRLAKKEEREVLKKFGDEYQKYMDLTPRFFPSMRMLKALWTVKQG